jgi:5'-3' exonuclease
MGIKGLFQFLKRFEKEVNIQSYLKQKRVGIDIFWFLYESRGDIFKFQSLITHIIKNSEQVYCVFDGKPSKEKIEQIKEQAKKRQELMRSIVEIERFLQYPFNRITLQDRNQLKEYLSQLKRQAWAPSPEYIEYIKQWLISKSCIIYQAEEEADDVLINLENNNVIDVIITNDSDLLILGGENILRIKSPTMGCLYKRSILRNKLNFTDKQWNDFMLLCKYMKEKDIILAYSIISVYKDLDYGLQKHYIYNNSNICYINPDCDY